MPAGQFFGSFLYATYSFGVVCGPRRGRSSRTSGGSGDAGTRLYEPKFVARRAHRRLYSCHQPWNNRGIAKRETNDRAGAIADFKKALEINPSLQAARNSLREL